MRRKTKLALATTLALTALIGTALSATYIFRFHLPKQAQITVTQNTWGLQLYTDELCTIIVNPVTFPSVEESVAGSFNTSKYYIKNIAETHAIYPKWNHTSLPAGITLTAWIYINGIEYSINNGGMSGYPIDASMNWKLPIKWGISVSPTITAGDYNFTINLYSFESV